MDLVNDYIVFWFNYEAESLGLPLVRPFLHDCDSVIEPGQGVNYAVVGATALNSSFLEARGIVNDLTNASLGVQLAWFKQSLASICSNVSGNQLSSCSLYSIQQGSTIYHICSHMGGIISLDIKLTLFSVFNCWQIVET